MTTLAPEPRCVKERLRIEHIEIAEGLGLLDLDHSWLELAGENVPTVSLLNKRDWPIDHFIGIDRDKGLIERAEAVRARLGQTRKKRTKLIHGDITQFFDLTAPLPGTVTLGLWKSVNVCVYDTQSQPETVLPTLPNLFAWGRKAGAESRTGCMVIVAVSLRGVSKKSKASFKQYIAHRLTEHQPSMWLEYRGHKGASKMLVIRLHFKADAIVGLTAPQDLALVTKGSKTPTTANRDEILEYVRSQGIVDRKTIATRFPEISNLVHVLAAMKAHRLIKGKANGYYLPKPVSSHAEPAIPFAEASMVKPDWRVGVLAEALFGTGWSLESVRNPRCSLRYGQVPLGPKAPLRVAVQECSLNAAQWFIYRDDTVLFESGCGGLHGKKVLQYALNDIRMPDRMAADVKEAVQHLLNGLIGGSFGATPGPYNGVDGPAERPGFDRRGPRHGKNLAPFARSEPSSLDLVRVLAAEHALSAAAALDILQLLTKETA